MIWTLQVVAWLRQIQHLGMLQRGPIESQLLANTIGRLMAVKEHKLNYGDAAVLLQEPAPGAARGPNVISQSEEDQRRILVTLFGIHSGGCFTFVCLLLLLLLLLLLWFFCLLFFLCGTLIVSPFPVATCGAAFDPGPLGLLRSSQVDQTIEELREEPSQVADSTNLEVPRPPFKGLWG